jgi:hypothetical protein
MAARNGNYKFQKPHFADAQATCRNPPTHKEIVPIASRPKLQHVTFLLKYKDKQFFCGHNILTEVMFVTQLSSDAGISV